MGEQMTLTRPTRTKPRLTVAVAELYPPRGQWTESEFFMLSERSNRLIELSDGDLEVLPLPTRRHQQILSRLLYLFFTYLETHAIGECLVAGIPVRLWPGKIREPDLVFMLNEHFDRISDQYWGPPDLAVEIHSPDTRKADRRQKFQEYAEAGVAEYWMIDPKAEGIEVHRLKGKDYELHGKFKAGDHVEPLALPGFVLSVDNVFKSVKPHA